MHYDEIGTGRQCSVQSCPVSFCSGRGSSRGAKDGRTLEMQPEHPASCKCKCSFTHTFSLTQLQHPLSSKAFAQTTVTGCDPTQTCREINAAPNSGQKHSVYSNKRKTIQKSGSIVLQLYSAHRNTDRQTLST